MFRAREELAFCNEEIDQAIRRHALSRAGVKTGIRPEFFADRSDQLLAGERLACGLNHVNNVVSVNAFHAPKNGRAAHLIKNKSS